MKHIALALTCALVVAGCGKKDDAKRGSDLPRTDTYTKTYETDTYESETPRTDPMTNTELNTRDKDGLLPLPTDQKENKADVERTADIRQRIVDAKLSTSADNVKVVTMDGRVTLRGPVKSEAERLRIVQIAKDVAGESNVDDLLEIEVVK
jgi:hyperosmotically inducible protein